MANLAAYDIAKAVQAAGLKARLACYTFGAPRTGNHAFAWDYRETVPDTWGLINDQVGLARSPSHRLLRTSLHAFGKLRSRILLTTSLRHQASLWHPIWFSPDKWFPHGLMSCHVLGKGSWPG